MSRCCFSEQYRQLTSILQEDLIMPGIDDMPVVFEGFMPIVVGTAMGGIPVDMSVGMAPIVSMMSTGTW